MTSGEISIWRAYDAVVGLPQRRAEWQIAKAMAGMAVMHGGAKKFDPIPWLPRNPVDGDVMHQTAEESMRVFESIIGVDS